MATVPEESPQQFTSSKDAKAHAKAAKAYRKASRPWYKKKRFWLLGLLALLIIIAIASGGGDDTDSASPTATENAATQPTEDATTEDEVTEEESPTEESTPTEEEAPAEEALVVTSRQMIDDLEANALNATNTYEGQLVTVTGYVGSIDASGQYFALDPEPDALILTGVQIQLDESHQELVSTFTSGQEVTVTGRVTSVGEVLGYSVEADTID